MEPYDFLQLAVRLSNDSNPAEIRTSISRAYYANHHMGRYVLKELTLEIKKSRNIHNEVISYFSNCGVPAIVEVGSKIANFKGWRHRADYELDDKNIERPTQAQNTVIVSKQVFQELSNCLEEPKKDEVYNGIMQWKASIIALRLLFRLI